MLLNWVLVCFEPEEIWIKVGLNWSTVTVCQVLIRTWIKNELSLAVFMCSDLNWFKLVIIWFKQEIKQIKQFYQDLNEPD